MKQYGETAIVAYEYYNEGFSLDDAWKKAASETIKSESGRKKGCPKNAFKGLFDNSVNGSNAKHGRDALTILRTNLHKSYTEKELWDLVKDYDNKKHNAQMDVVLALWNEGYLKEL